MKISSIILKKKIAGIAGVTFFLLVCISSALAVDQQAAMKPPNNIKDLWEVRSFQVAVFSAILTAFTGFLAAWWAVWVWWRDLRWKQAELARTLLDEIFDYGPSNDAWRMVDGEETYNEEKGNVYLINMDQVRRALPKPWNDDRGGPDVYVRWCFDALLYYLERLEQSVKIKLVRIEDLTAPTSYYIALMANDKKLFQDYAELIRFRGAIAFMNRFPEWHDKKI
jgi:hypothetical protein